MRKETRLSLRAERESSRAVAVLVAAFIVAAMGGWAEAERERRDAQVSRRLVIVPASDTARFNECKAAGGFIDLTDGPDGSGPVPFVCEYRPMTRGAK